MTTARLAMALALSLAAAPAVAEDAPAVPLDQLMSIGRLPDITQGSPSAPITIVEYASMTCTHCAAFHEKTWPALKSKYVDTGRAKFILREFPLDPLAAAAFMFARCAGAEKRDQLVDKLFAEQKTWVVEKPVEPLLAEAKTVGLNQTEFDACLHNQDLYKQVMQSRERAEKAFAIDATPTFFVNGQKRVGELTIADFDKAIDAIKP